MSPIGTFQFSGFYLFIYTCKHFFIIYIGIGTNFKHVQSLKNNDIHTHKLLFPSRYLKKFYDCTRFFLSVFFGFHETRVEYLLFPYIYYYYIYPSVLWLHCHGNTNSEYAVNCPHIVGLITIYVNNNICFF